MPGSENYIFINKSECNWINEFECKVTLSKNEYKFIDSSGEKEEILTGKEINNYFTSQDKKSNDIKVEDVKIDENVFTIRRNKIRDVKELANAIVLLRKENISNRNEFRTVGKTFKKSAGGNYAGDLFWKGRTWRRHIK